MYRIDKEKCVGCGTCAFICIYSVPIGNDDDITYEINHEKCNGCGQCEMTCPNSAIASLAL